MGVGTSYPNFVIASHVSSVVIQAIYDISFFLTTPQLFGLRRTPDPDGPSRFEAGYALRKCGGASDNGIAGYGHYQRLKGLAVVARSKPFCASVFSWFVARHTRVIADNAVTLSYKLNCSFLHLVHIFLKALVGW